MVSSWYVGIILKTGKRSYLIESHFIKQPLIVLYDLKGHVEFAGDLVRVPFVHGFGCPVFERVDQLQRGLPPGAVFDPGAVDACPGVVGVLPVNELMDERAAFLAVDEPPVDEDGAGGFIVEAGLPVGEVCAADGDVEAVGVPAHLPVRHP